MGNGKRRVKSIFLRGLALPLSMCLILAACVVTPRQTDQQRAQPTESSVAAWLEQLQPSSTVVEGDPIETKTLEELLNDALFT